uniref:nicotinamidase n=1 Tax=Hirondellea gigas TaxID=1518452 RepID=A0A6A7FYU1_9CRUS
MSKSSALIIVDVQNDFCPPKGSLQVAGGLEAIDVINQIRKDNEFKTIILTQDFHPQNHSSFHSNNAHHPKASLFQPLDLGNGKSQVMWPDHCVQGSKGCEFHPKLVRQDSDIIVQKGKHVEVDSYSGFFDNDHKSKTDLHDILKENGITDVFVVGLAYDYCVGYTAIDAHQLGYKTRVIEDATRAVAEDSKIERINEMKALGIDILQSKEISGLF